MSTTNPPLNFAPADASECAPSELSCSHCGLAALCLPLALADDEIVQLEHIVQRSRPLRKGAHLYRERDPFTAIYVVRAGTFKGYRITDSGEEQVIGFYYPGEILGFDGISTNKHTSSAKALETGSICEIQFDALSRLSATIPMLQQRVFQMVGQEIARDQQLIMQLGKNTADQRVAALLFSISTRNARRGLSATRFLLPMTRAEIGNYLGLAMESVSRVLSHLQAQNVIAVEGKDVVVQNLDRLRNTANGCMD